MTLRVLFVDDEENILNGLRRSLRGMRNVWSMDFATSGREALDKMEESPFHIVVTDMRMPGMAGDELLNRVRQKYPNTMRIILSGFAENESILRTVGPAHQYLAKPCEPQLLIDTIRNSLSLQRFVGKKEIRDLVSGIDKLPTPQLIFFQLLKEFERPAASAHSVAELISTDIALTAQVLRLTNSAFFALPVKATTLLQAVSLLGFDTLRAVILKAGIFDHFHVRKSVEADYTKLSQNCLSIGQLAWNLAKADGADSGITSHTQCAGILSHLGSLLLMAHKPESFIRSCAECEVAGTTIYEKELELYELGHPELGGYLLGLWGFANPIVEAVAYHHLPSQSECKRISALTYVHVAQHFCATWNARHASTLPSAYSLDEEYLERVGALDKLDNWKEIADVMREKELANA